MPYKVKAVRHITSQLGVLCLHIIDIGIKETLSPKDLISRYRLDKSHIAFTLCTKSLDNSYEIHPETTVISTMITESSSKSKSNGIEYDLYRWSEVILTLPDNFIMSLLSDTKIYRIWLAFASDLDSNFEIFENPTASIYRERNNTFIYFRFPIFDSHRMWVPKVINPLSTNRSK